jgi:hypothetical protein
VTRGTKAEVFFIALCVAELADEAAWHLPAVDPLKAPPYFELVAPSAMTRFTKSCSGCSGYWNTMTSPRRGGASFLIMMWLPIARVGSIEADRIL